MKFEKLRKNGSFAKFSENWTKPVWNLKLTKFAHVQKILTIAVAIAYKYTKNHKNSSETSENYIKMYRKLHYLKIEQNP